MADATGIDYDLIRRIHLLGKMPPMLPSSGILFPLACAPSALGYFFINVIIGYVLKSLKSQLPCFIFSELFLLRRNHQRSMLYVWGLGLCSPFIDWWKRPSDDASPGLISFSITAFYNICINVAFFACFSFFVCLNFACVELNGAVVMRRIGILMGRFETFHRSPFTTVFPVPARTHS